MIVLTVALGIATLDAEGQPRGTPPRIGILLAFPPQASPRADAFREGLRELGYVDGQNISIEWRWGEGEAFQELAVALVRLPVDVIVAGNPPAIAAARKATRTIPIVMVYPADPVRDGFITSLALPGGNLTGLSQQAYEMRAKRLQLLKEVVPTLMRLAILWDPSEPGRRAEATEASGASRALGLQPQLFEARAPTDLERAFAAMVQQRAGAVLVGGSSTFFAHRARISELARRHRLPTITAFPEYAEAGFLMSFSSSITALFRRAPYFVDKLLKGVKPADLPVEQPTKFELVINLGTAKALSLTIPQSLLLQADRVIQ